jgi:hypothetical protein
MTGMTATPGEFDPDVANTGEKYITTLTLPDAATSVKAGTDYNNRTFRYFTGLKKVNGEYVVTVGSYAFAGCTVLTMVTLPAAQTIGDYVFVNCTALEEVSLPAAIIIGNYAFINCTALEEVSLPASLSNIGGGAFRDCTSLTNISVDAGNSNFSANGGSGPSPLWWT